MYTNIIMTQTYRSKFDKIFEHILYVLLINIHVSMPKVPEMHDNEALNVDSRLK